MINKIADANIRLARKLKVLRVSLLEDANINNSQFEILYYLNAQQDCTMSSIARDLEVSRQHIQKTIVSMQALKLVKTRKNRDHMRSPFIEISARGKKLFDIIYSAEQRIHRKIARNFDKDALQETLDTLQQLEDQLDNEVFSLYD